MGQHGPSNGPLGPLHGALRDGALQGADRLELILALRQGKVADLQRVPSTGEYCAVMSQPPEPRRVRRRELAVRAGRAVPGLEARRLEATKELVLARQVAEAPARPFVAPDRPGPKYAYNARSERPRDLSGAKLRSSAPLGEPGSPAAVPPPSAPEAAASASASLASQPDSAAKRVSFKTTPRSISSKVSEVSSLDIGCAPGLRIFRSAVQARHPLRHPLPRTPTPPDVKYCKPPHPGPLWPGFEFERERKRLPKLKRPKRIVLPEQVPVVHGIGRPPVDATLLMIDANTKGGITYFDTMGGLQQVRDDSW